MPAVTPHPPRAGQESVWDYPRPPRLEPWRERIVVWFAGERIIDTRRAWRVLETSHPPVYYLPPDDLRPGVLRPSDGAGSWCEWKGQASYLDVVVNDQTAPRAAFTYRDPTELFRPIAGYASLYAGPMQRCEVGGHLVTPQPGGFYSGWITPHVAGPFKGSPGTSHW